MAKEMAAAVRRARGATGFGPMIAIARGVLAAIAVTVLGVVLFALLIKWLGLSDTAISALNQAVKLVAVAIGVRACVGRGGTGGAIKGALVGLLYMMLGVMGYAFLSGLTLSPAAYLADLGMGVAAGGLIGMVLSNMKAK